MQRTYIKKWKLFVGSIIIFMATFIVSYHAYFLPGTDIYYHTTWALEDVDSIFDFISNVLSYPLWHYTTRFLYVVFGFEEPMAAAIAMAMYNMLTYIAIDYFCKELFPEICDETGNYILLLMMVFFVGPLYYPRFNIHYYEGQWSPNPWHNPTNITVRFFTVLALTLIGIIIENAVKIYHYILLAVVLLLSALAKPAFLQGIIPGLGLYMIISMFIKKDKNLLVKYIKIIVAFIPSVMYMVYQFFMTVTTNKSNSQNQSDVMGVGFAWGREMHEWTTNMGMSFLLAFAFPVIVFVFNYKTVLKNKIVQIICCFEVAAWLEGALLYFKGKEGACDFVWASILSMFMVWLIAIIIFIKDHYEAREEKKTIMYWLYEVISYIALGGHLFLGILKWMVNVGIINVAL